MYHFSDLYEPNILFLFISDFVYQMSKANSLQKNFSQILIDDLEKPDFSEKLLSVLKDDTKLGHDPAIAAQSEGFVESYVGMDDYSAQMITGERPEAVGYGTRTHSIILVDENDKMTFTEVDRDLEKVWTERTEIFQLSINS